MAPLAILNHTHRKTIQTEMRLKNGFINYNFLNIVSQSVSARSLFIDFVFIMSARSTVKWGNDGECWTIEIISNATG